MENLGLVHAVVVAGGGGLRLGGASKPDLRIGDRLLDVVLDGLSPFVTGTMVVVAPESVSVPADVIRVMEEPPGGGPLAGLDAGVGVLMQASAGGDDLVLVTAVDSPGFSDAVPLLLDAVGDRVGALLVAGEPEPFRQYLMAVYRLAPLTSRLDEARRKRGSLHGVGVRRVLGELELVEVPVPAAMVRDIDTLEDLGWWRARVKSQPLFDGSRPESSPGLGRSPGFDHGGAHGVSSLPGPHH